MTTRALTPEDFVVTYDENHTFQFFEDEDGNGVYGYGHYDKQTFATAVNYYDNLCDGERYFDLCDVYTFEDVNHGYARADDDNVYGEWALRFCKAEDEYASPVTWLSR